MQHARRLASCQRAAHIEAEAVLLQWPTIESLVEVLSQLSAPNGIYDNVLNATRQRRSKRHEYTSEEHKASACLDYINRTRDDSKKLDNRSLIDMIHFKI